MPVSSSGSEAGACMEGIHAAAAAVLCPRLITQGPRPILDSAWALRDLSPASPPLPLAAPAPLLLLSGCPPPPLPARLAGRRALATRLTSRTCRWLAGRVCGGCTARPLPPPPPWSGRAGLPATRPCPDHVAPGSGSRVCDKLLLATAAAARDPAGGGPFSDPGGAVHRPRDAPSARPCPCPAHRAGAAGAALQVPQAILRDAHVWRGAAARLRAAPHRPCRLLCRTGARRPAFRGCGAAALWARVLQVGPVPRGARGDDGACFKRGARRKKGG